MNIDIDRAVTYPFEDRAWLQKVAVLLVVGLIPGLNVIVWAGYAVTVARNIYHGEAHPLPAWAEWSDIAVRGLLAIVAALLYHLPLLLMGCCLWITNLFLGGRSSGGTILIPLECCVGAVSIVYLLAANLLLSAGHVRFVQSDQFYRYGELARRFQDLRADPSLFINLLVYEALAAVVGIGVGLLLSITCIGLIAMLTMMFLASGYILGAAANAARNSSRVPELMM